MPDASKTSHPPCSPPKLDDLVHAATNLEDPDRSSDQMPNCVVTHPLEIEVRGLAFWAPVLDLQGEWYEVCCHVGGESP